MQGEGTLYPHRSAVAPALPRRGGFSRFLAAAGRAYLDGWVLAVREGYAPAGTIPRAPGSARPYREEDR